MNSDPEKEDIFRKLRLDRFIVDHLLRAGYFETAEALIETVGLEMRANLDVFRTAKEVFFKLINILNIIKNLK